MLAALVLGIGSFAASADPARVCFVGVRDGSGELDPEVTRTLTSALGKMHRFTWVPASDWQAAVDAAGIDVAASLRAPAIDQIGGSLGVAVVVSAAATTSDALGARIEVTAQRTSDGKVIATGHRQVSIDFGATAATLRLSPRDADVLANELLRRANVAPRPIVAPRAEAAPPTSTAPAAAPSTPPATTGAETAVAPGTAAPASTGASPAAAGVPDAPAPGSPSSPPAPLSADDGASLDALLAQKPDFKIGLTAAFYEWIYFFDEPGRVPGRHEIDGALQVTGTTPLYTASARLLARKDFGDATRDRLEAEEAWVEIGHWGLRLRAGRNIIVWDPWINAAAPPGSPITPTDTRDLIRSEVLPVYNVRVAYDLGPTTFELYYLPVPERNLGTFTPTGSIDGRFTSTSRWYVDGSFEKNIFKGKTPAPVELDETNPPPPSPDNAQGLARVYTHLDDFRAYVAYGYVLSLNPAAQLGAPLADGTVPVSFAYARQHLVDSAAAMTFGWFTFGGELTMTAAPDFKKIDAASIVGVGMTSPLIADAHRFGGGVLVLPKSNLLPALQASPGDISKSLLGSTSIAYGTYGYGRAELKLIVLQGGTSAVNLLELAQLKVKIGLATAAVTVSSALGQPTTLFGAIPGVDRVEMSLGAVL